jgi:hypothetical protein
MVNNFTKGCLAKFLLELATKRSLIKIWRKSKSDIVRFGFIIGITATTFHAVLCLLRRLGKKKGYRFALNMGRKLAMILAAAVSALPLVYGL